MSFQAPELFMPFCSIDSTSSRLDTSPNHIKKKNKKQNPAWMQLFGSYTVSQLILHHYSRDQRTSWDKIKSVHDVGIMCILIHTNLIKNFLVIPM